MDCPCGHLDLSVWEVGGTSLEEAAWRDSGARASVEGRVHDAAHQVDACPGVCARDAQHMQSLMEFLS